MLGLKTGSFSWVRPLLPPRLLGSLNLVVSGSIPTVLLQKSDSGGQQVPAGVLAM